MGGNVKIKKKKEAMNDNNNNDANNKRKLNAVDEKKLHDELTNLITKILKKFPDGLEMIALWRKITASISAESNVIKKVLPRVLKTLAKLKDKNGKKKYCLKDKYK